MSKLIIENKTNLSDEDILLRALAVVKQGRISNYGKQYCYAITWPDGIVMVSGLNGKSDRLVFYCDERYDDKKGKL